MSTLVPGAQNRVVGNERSSQSMDIERLLLVPVFTVFLVYGAFVLAHSLGAASSGTPVRLLTLVYQALLTIFYVLTIVLFVLRRDARATARGFLPRTLAYVATFAPLSLAFFPPARVELLSLVLVASVMTVGLLFATYSLLTLGRSFGITPQVRTLVRTGPYRVIRHPLYVGEAVTFLGAILLGFSAARLTLFVSCMLIQWYRAGQEETLLEQSIPEYAAYKATTWRFVPGLV
jgi:protein-S-isoprenylcysteine O-methyltransferase Ste14